MESAFYYDDEEHRRRSSPENSSVKDDSPEVHRAPIAPHFEGLILLRDHEKQENQPTVPEHAPLQSVVEAPKDTPQPYNEQMSAPLPENVTSQLPHTAVPGEAQSWQQRQQVEQHPVAGEVQQFDEAGHMPRAQQDAWRRYWVDEHGREIAGATTYGQAYYQERQVETQPTVSQAATPTSYSPTQPVGAPNWAAQLPGSGSMPTTDVQSSLTNADGSAYFAVGQQMPAEQVDLTHRLPPKTPRPLLQNPWLWLMLTIVMAAFFATIFM